MTDDDPLFNPYGDADVGKMIHNASCFPHGRYELPPLEGTPWKTIWERTAICPYCPEASKGWARRCLSELEEQ
jgi:hypothetical protein